MQSAKYIPQLQYSLLIYIGDIQWQQSSRNSRTVAQNQQFLFQKSIGKIVSWNFDDRQAGFETNFLGYSSTDLRAEVPLILLFSFAT